MANHTGKRRKSSRKADPDKDAFRKGEGSGQDRQVPSKECLDELRRFGALDKELQAQLKLPKRLYSHGSPERPSYSSDPAASINPYASSIMQGMDRAPPEGLPEYGIAIASRGSSVFCVLVDRKRGIIVSESVRDPHAPEGSWRPFASALKEALEYGDWLKSQGSGVRFVMRGDRRDAFQ